MSVAAVAQETGRTALLPLHKGPCPSCSALLGQLDGAADHVAQRVNSVAVGNLPLGHVLGFAADRGWRRLRLLSPLGTTCDHDYSRETAEGHQ